MRWRALVERTGSDGSVSEAILATGERVGPGHDASMPGLTSTEGKAMIAACNKSWSKRKPPGIAISAADAPRAARGGR